MNELVIFASPLMYAAIGLILLLHIASAAISVIWAEREWARIAVLACAVLNFILHIGVFVFALIEKAPAEEMLLTLMLSAAVGLIAMGVAERLGDRRCGNREESED